MAKAQAGDPAGHEPQAAATHAVDEQALFEVVGSMYDLDPDLLEAIASVESSGREYAVSPAGALGLMQLMPATARRFRVANPFDPVENVLGAARFLDDVRKSEERKTGRDVPLAEFVAAYNAGAGAVDKYQGVPPYAETREYVRRILWRYLIGSPLPPAREPVRIKRGSAPRPAPRESSDLTLLKRLENLRHRRDLAQHDQNADAVK